VYVLATQGVGELADLFVQLAVSDVAAFGRIIPFPNDRDLITALGVIEYFDAPTLSALLGKFDAKYFLIDFPDSEGRKRTRLQWYLRQVYLRVNRCPGVYLYSQDEFRRMAAEQGFEDLWFVRRSAFDFATNLPRS